MIKNKFKERLYQDHIQYGIWNGLVDSYAGEICAGAGFDWVLIDAEHAPFDLRTIVHQLQSIKQYEVPAIVRIPQGEPSLIKQLLDAGVQNLLVPMIESALQAEAMVKAMRYAPDGIRGVGTALARAAQWNRVNDYFKIANQEMCLIIQIESIKGVEALDEILAVDGVDVIFIGPADLAATMGHLGQPGHPEVVQVVEDCLEKIVSAGKYPGFLTSSADLITKYVAKGAKMIGVGIDTILLAKATQELAQKYVGGTASSNTIY